MNERFVNVKVDREERPDDSALYMDAVVALTGHSGWPTVFLTPEGEPFFGGTYFARAEARDAGIRRRAHRGLGSLSRAPRGGRVGGHAARRCDQGVERGAALDRPADRGHAW